MTWRGYSFSAPPDMTGVQTDLITLAELKLALGITTTTEDAALQASISRVSRQIAEYCDRIFALIAFAETFVFRATGWPYPCPCAGPHPVPLVLKQYPVGQITALTRDGTAIAPEEYDLDAESGRLWPRSGVWSGRMVAEYSGGYALPDGAPDTLQTAVIEAVRQRRAYATRDPSIREVAHGSVRVGFFSAPAEAASGGSGPLYSIAAALDQFRRQYV